MNDHDTRPGPGTRRCRQVAAQSPRGRDLDLAHVGPPDPLPGGAPNPAAGSPARPRQGSCMNQVSPGPSARSPAGRDRLRAGAGAGCRAGDVTKRPQRHLIPQATRMLSPITSAAKQSPRSRACSPGPRRTTSARKSAAAPVRSWQDRGNRSRAAPTRRRAATRTARPASPHPHPRHGTGRSPLASEGGRRARTVAAGAAAGPGPRPKLPRLARLTTDTNTHLDRPRATALEQVICAVGTANTYRMSRHSYSAFCADGCQVGCSPG